MWDAYVAIGVGILWGLTNALMQHGVSKAVKRSPPARVAAVVGDHWARLIVAKTFVVAQLLNWCASAVLILYLKGASLHCVTPLANAVTVIANAIYSSCFLGHKSHLRWLVPGIVLTSVGAALIAY